MLVAESLDAHVAEAHRALRGGEGEDAATGGVELGSGYHLSEVLHVRGLHVHDICNRRAQHTMLVQYCTVQYTTVH